MRTGPRLETRLASETFWLNSRLDMVIVVIVALLTRLNIVMLLHKRSTGSQSRGLRLRGARAVRGSGIGAA